MASKACLPPDSPELQFLRQRFEEVPSLPGAFRAWCSPFRPGPLGPLPPGEVHFRIDDPYQRNLPFHLSAHFVVLDGEMRREFLFRNPRFLCLLLLAEQGIRRLAQLSGNGVIALADREVALGTEAITELADKFGMYCTWHDGDGHLISPPRWLSYSWLADPTYGGRTVRERRVFQGAMARRLRELGWPARRAPSAASLNAALAVWDAREGRTGPLDDFTLGYEPAQALSLREANRRTRTSPNDYYRAFRYVIGEKYSRAEWLVSVGWVWHLREVAHSGSCKRRESGRPRGTRRDPEPDAITRFFQLLQQGTEIEVAARLADLSPPTARTLSAPQNREKVFAFAQDPANVMHLLASL
jgi:hypothetical protein